MVSGGIVFREALRLLNRLELPEEANRDLLKALEAGRKQNPMPLLYEAGAEAGLDREALLGRTSALYIGWCAGNLCDDLVDGDCDWLDPVRIGPATQFILHHVFFTRLLELGLPPSAITDALHEIVHAASWAHVEVRTTQWTLQRYQDVAEMQGGRQWVSWMKLLWWGTPLAGHATRFGRNAAVAAFVAEDLRSEDPRFTTMSEDEKKQAFEWAREAAADLDGLGLRVCAYVRAGLEGPLGLTPLGASDAG